MSLETSYYALVGGLDLVTPAISTPPGHVIAGSNFEPQVRGYRRYQGHERHDGQLKPSAASYAVLQFDAGQAAIAEGDSVTGATSAATAIALIDAVVQSGTYGGSDAAGYLVLMVLSGTFQNDENLQVSAATKSVANGTAVDRGADNDADDTTWYRDAIETARALIAAVPGSGRVRGVWGYGGALWAFRDNAGGTAGVMHKATASGWSARDLGYRLAFDSGGTTEIAEGDTITGATSGATAVVTRVALQDGTWAGGDAEGLLIFASQTGTFQAENLNVGASANVATIAGDSTANTLPAGGVYEFQNYNFYGSSDLRRMYGANGVGTAFEWDGTVFVPLQTGMAVDTPTHVACHKKHIFLSFPGGAVQYAFGQPYEWTILSGGAEIGIGEDITGMVPEYAGILVLFGRNTVHILYGSSSSDFDLQPFTNDSGAVAGTMQLIGPPVYLDDRGLRSLATSQKFGDFNIGSFTQMVEPLFKSKRESGAVPTCSMRVRAKDQYRIFWDDGTGAFLYLGRKQPEVLPFDLGNDLVARCACSVEDDAGNEVLFFGGDDGMVYQMDAGTSADGAEVDAFIRLPFNHLGKPFQDKRFFGVDLETDGGPETTLKVSAEFGYGAADLLPVQEIEFTVHGGGGYWDEANWDEFNWDSEIRGLAQARFDGFGSNMSVLIVSQAIYEDPHTLSGITILYSPRRLRR